MEFPAPSPGILALGALGAIAVLGVLVGLGLMLFHVWTEYRERIIPDDGVDNRTVRVIVDPSPSPNPGHALVGGVTPPTRVGLSLALL